MDVRLLVWLRLVLDELWKLVMLVVMCILHYAIGGTDNRANQGKMECLQMEQTH